MFKEFEFTTQFTGPRDKFIKLMQKKTSLVIWICSRRKGFKIKVEYNTTADLNLAKELALQAGMEF
jgi:hypothetical protein